jgi:hypothetical protein
MAGASQGTQISDADFIAGSSSSFVKRQWQRSAWVTCELECNGRRRDVFGANTYSELFFLDEATALSAGHRPCATCRRARYDEFKSKWLVANGTRVSLPNSSIGEIDKILHSERADRSGAKATFEASLSSLPLGAFVEVNGEALLVWHQGLTKWSFWGYSDVKRVLDQSTRVRVLTPDSVVRTLATGFRPTVHPSANR